MDTVRNPHYFAQHFPGVEKQFLAPLPFFLNGDVDAREGLAANGVVIGKYLQNYVPYALEYDDSAAADSQYADVTADLNATGTETVFGTSEEVDDALYLGDDQLFGGLLIDMNTAGVGGTLVFEYLNNVGVWTSLATAHELIDDSVGLTAGTSTYYTTWKIPSDWGTGDVGDAGASFSAKYWVRIRVTAATITTAPVVASIETLDVTSSDGFVMPFDCYVESVSFTCDTEADDDDLELNIINGTRGTTGTVTLADDTRAGSAALNDPSYGVYFKKGDKLLVQATSTASVEMANVNLTLVCRV